MHATVAIIFIDDGRRRPAALLVRLLQRRLPRRLDQLGLRLGHIGGDRGDLPGLRFGEAAGKASATTGRSARRSAISMVENGRADAMTSVYGTLSVKILATGQNWGVVAEPWNRLGGPDGREVLVLAIRGAHLFDGQTLRSGWPMALVDRGSIFDVDFTGADPPPHAQFLDLGDVTLMPGLVDAHVHLAFDPAADPVEQMRTQEDAEVLSGMALHAWQALRAGITTVRDLGDRNYLAVALRQRYAAGEELGPEVLAAGPPITRTRGHCWFLGGEADGITGVKAAVTARVERGADVIKIMATGGMLTPGWGLHESQYGPGELAAAAEVAHGLGRRLCAHAHGPEGIADAVAAGADSVEHCTFVTENGVEPDWATVRAIIERGIVVGATEAWLPEGAPIPPVAASRLERCWENFARMHREGAIVVCCSDAGIGPRKPHDVLPHGVALFGSIGFTNLEALASATAQAAAACGVGDRKGRIARGYDADILAVAGNALHRLDALLEVRAVFRAGTRVDLAARGRTP